MGTQATARSKRQTSHEFYQKLYKLARAGGAAFWITDFAISVSPIAAEYRAAYLLIDTGMNVPRFLALGIVVGRLYDKLNGGA